MLIFREKKIKAKQMMHSDIRSYKAKISLYISAYTSQMIAHVYLPAPKPGVHIIRLPDGSANCPHLPISLSSDKGRQLATAKPFTKVHNSFVIFETLVQLSKMIESVYNLFLSHMRLCECTYENVHMRTLHETSIVCA